MPPPSVLRWRLDEGTGTCRVAKFIETDLYNIKMENERIRKQILHKPVFILIRKFVYIVTLTFKASDMILAGNKWSCQIVLKSYCETLYLAITFCDIGD